VQVGWCSDATGAIGISAEVVDPRDMALVKRLDRIGEEDSRVIVMDEGYGRYG